MTFAARTVADLATRDYGGAGRALLLMHGAGMDQRSLEAVARLLPDSRVVTFDFRGHGDSAATGSWTLAQAVDDVRAVAMAYGLERPVVGGHSLGGMVAAAYAAEHPAAAVINIDGHGRGREQQYPGYAAADVRAAWVRQDQRVERLTTGLRSVAIGAVLRAVGQRPISGETALQVTRAAATIDLPALYEGLTCPLLVFNAMAAEQSWLMRLWAGEGLRLAGAYRQGLARDLADLAARRPGTQVVTLDAPHVLVRTHPALVAEHIRAFLRSVEPAQRGRENDRPGE